MSSRDTLDRIAQILGVPVAAFYGGRCVLADASEAMRLFERIACPDARHEALEILRAIVVRGMSDTV